LCVEHHLHKECVRCKREEGKVSETIKGRVEYAPDYKSEQAPVGAQKFSLVAARVKVLEALLRSARERLQGPTANTQLIAEIDEALAGAS
jgi:hypothetical protein